MKTVEKSPVEQSLKHSYSLRQATATGGTWDISMEGQGVAVDQVLF